MKNILVTGTGRCGTLTMSHILGIPHENLWGKHYIEGFGTPQRLESESSWLMAPFLKDLNDGSWVVIHVVRRPIDVITSLRWTLCGRGDPWYEVYALAHCNLGSITDPVDRAIMIHGWWLDMCTEIEDVRVRIEDVRSHLYNMRGPYPPIAWTHEQLKRINERHKQLGYDAIDC